MAYRASMFSGFFGLVIGLFLLSLPQQPARLNAQSDPKKMREEEEEPEKSKVPKKIDEVEAKNPNPPGSVRQPPPQGTFNIGQEAQKARNPFIKEMLKRITLPYDNLVSATGRSYKIGLMTERKLPMGKFTYVQLNDTLLAGKEKELPTGAGFTLQPYEEIVLEEVDTLLTKKIIDVKRDEIIDLSVQVLQATRRFHAAAVEQKKRVGKDWEEVDDKLRKRIIQLRRDQLQTAVQNKEWKKADELSLELSNYTDDPEAKRDIYRLLLLKELEALKVDSDEDYLKLRDAVNQFENQGDGRGEELTKTARERLRARAQQYVDRAKKMAADNQTVAAFNLLKNADAIDPDLKTIQELRSTLRDRILYVGVSKLPDLMSPVLARTDVERWAVELMFESLLQPIPDLQLGRHYRPVLADSLPTLVPMGREFTLHKNTRWSGDGGKTLDARDVFGTLDLLRKLPNLPSTEGIDVLDVDKVRIEDLYHVRIGFKQGILEPLNRATFKVLPARYLKAHGLNADNNLFAKNPFGSGPYRFAGIEDEGAERKAAVFKANPYYSQRAGKFGLPNIREIRLVVSTRLSNIGNDLAKGQLHLVLDVPTGDIPRYLDDPNSAGSAKVFTPTINRRVYMLAVNHRRGALQDVNLRRGLAAAVDREAVLRDVFRPNSRDTHHRALTGPFPLNCWATPAKARKPEAALFNKELAAGLFNAAAGRSSIPLTLQYPADDQLAARACSKMKAQIEDASKKTPEEAPSITITLDPVPGETFFHRIEKEQDFQLAYVPYDYKDDLYWLGSLLDRTAAGSGERNFLGYLAEGSNPQVDDLDLRNSLDNIRSHRNFRDVVREETWKVHAKFLNRMPFIPLWQLDRHMIVHNGLEMYLDNPAEKITPDRVDPATMFTGIEFWRLK